MRRITTCGGRWVLGLLLTCGFARTAAAIYLDEEQNISLRARIYSQAGIRTNDSQPGTTPNTKVGQLIQNRNFFNPELDAKLTSYTSRMKDAGLGWLAPDDFGLRIAAWGFYDGIYDYGADQFDDSRRMINSTYPDSLPSPNRVKHVRDDLCGSSPDPVGCINSHFQTFYLEGARYNPKGATFGEIFPQAEVRNPREVYATQRRLNELYLNYSKGPLFVRLGKQSISWGESDTIAILDQNNPFDVTLGAPGVFEDLDEARMPLWTVRTSLQLFDTLGPVSSGFVEAYWVPGDIDVNTGMSPTLLGASPYTPRIPDQQPKMTGLNRQSVLYDKIPRQRFENSRWGVRAQTVVARDFTVSAWFYTHYPNAPVPVKLAPASTNGTGRCKGAVGIDKDCAGVFATATVHELTSVVGASTTFFLEPVDGIVRMEAEYFDNEPSFIPEVNLGILPGNVTNSVTATGTIPHADYLRWELGYDRFFFLRPLNPTNSFILVTAIVGSWNLSETSQKDFRMNGQTKSGIEPDQISGPQDFVQQQKVEAFAQMHVQTDYMHGRLSPDFTYIQNVRGTYALLPKVTYRFTDWLIFSIGYVHIGGEYQQLGFFRDRDQLTLRAAYQLN